MSCSSVCEGAAGGEATSILRLGTAAVAQDWSPTEAKQGWAWLVPGWETTRENRVLLEEVLGRPAGGAHPAVCVGPSTAV